ncbi:MAG: flagellar FlbD family protein [Planctomycetes bacterium]|nr:flagellar FlbD family protein [Planctomycetota bacterium]
MIRATRLNRKEFVVNAELIQYVEETPDTVITLSNKEKILVVEPVEEIIRRVLAYQRSIRTFKSP